MVIVIRGHETLVQTPDPGLKRGVNQRAENEFHTLICVVHLEIDDSRPACCAAFRPLQTLVRSGKPHERRADHV